MDADELKRRTKAFALRIVRLVESLPNTSSARVIGNQLLRSGTSVGANYRTACRARSHADFVSKIGVVEEEADESAYWLELLVEAGILSADKVKDLVNEANELTAIFTSSGHTAKQSAARRTNPQSEIRNPKLKGRCMEPDEFQQLMKARQGVYDLLRCFFLQEPTEALFQALREEDVIKNLSGYHPELDEGVQLLGGIISSPGVQQLVPNLLLEFTRLFVGPSPVPLYESVYRSQSGLVMQEETLAVRKKYMEAGLVVHPDRSFPDDHIGAELEFVFYLCQKAAEAQKTEELFPWLKMQQAFFQDHLNHWVPPLCDRLFQEAESAYFKGIAKTTKGFITWDFEEIVSHFFD
jgi:four helix bundle protein